MGKSKRASIVGSGLLLLYIVGFFFWVPIIISAEIFELTGWRRPFYSTYSWIWNLEEDNFLRAQASRYTAYWCDRLDTCADDDAFVN